MVQLGKHVHIEQTDNKQWHMQIIDKADNSLLLEIYGELFVPRGLTRDAQQRNEADRAGAAEMEHIIPCPQCGLTRETNMTVVKECPYCGDAEWVLKWQRESA